MIDTSTEAALALAQHHELHGRPQTAALIRALVAERDEAKAAANMARATYDPMAASHAHAFIRDLVDMQSGGKWTRSQVREAAADFLRNAGVRVSNGRDTSPLFARAEAAEARVKVLEEALRPFARACRAIGDELGPFRIEALTGYRMFEREDLRRARAALEGKP
jgi:hypothetical protein